MRCRAAAHSLEISLISALTHLACQYATALHHVEKGLSGGAPERIGGGPQLRFYKKSIFNIDCLGDQILYERECPGGHGDGY